MIQSKGQSCRVVVHPSVGVLAVQQLANASQRHRQLSFVFRGDKTGVRGKNETIKCVFSRLSSFPGNIRVTRTRLGLLSVSHAPHTHTYTQNRLSDLRTPLTQPTTHGGGGRRNPTNFGQKREKAAEVGHRFPAQDGRGHLITLKQRLTVEKRAHAPLPRCVPRRAHEARAKMSGRSLVQGLASGARPDV